MILSLIVIALVVVIAYIWASRGLFSAFLHMVCVFVAGAIAFAAWEPTSQAIMTVGWLSDAAWGLGLALPFGVALAVIRISLDKILPANVDLDGITNLVGGGLCGAVSGTLAVGILVIAVSFLRLGTTVAGFTPFDYDGNGSLVRKHGIILPADRIAAATFGALSTGAFRTSNSLAYWHPDLASEGALLRMTFPQPEGGGKTIIMPNAYEVLGHYTFTPKDAKELTKDTIDTTGRSQTYTYLDGTQMNAGGSYIEGYVVRFKPSAKEKSGVIVVGNGQMRLVVEKQDGTTMSVLPMAMVSQAKGDKPTLGRWRFDAQKTFIASVGGRDDAPMAFEFPVPKGSKPVALYTKGIRTDVRGMNTFAAYETGAARDGAIKGGTITPTVNVAKLDKSRAFKYKIDRNSLDAQIRVVDSLFQGTTLQTDALAGLEIDESNKNAIIGGEGKFNKDQTQIRGIDPKLQVRKFGATEDTVIVQVTVGVKNPDFGLLSGPAADIDLQQGPILFDQNGQPYSPVGFMYRTTQELHIRFTPQTPILHVADLPSLSRSQPDQELVLIYRISRNVKVTMFAVGDKVLAEFAPPLETPK